MHACVQVSCIEVCWLGGRQLVHFPPPIAASHLPPEYEEELMRSLLAQPTPHARGLERYSLNAAGLAGCPRCCPAVTSRAFVRALLCVPAD